jgi:hypothetical protein
MNRKMAPVVSLVRKPSRAFYICYVSCPFIDPHDILFTSSYLYFFLLFECFKHVFIPRRHGRVQSSVGCAAVVGSVWAGRVRRKLFCRDMAPFVPLKDGRRKSQAQRRHCRRFGVLACLLCLNEKGSIEK